MVLSDPGYDPFAGIDFAILFGVSIFVLDRFRCKRQYPFDIRMDNNGLENLMMIPNIPCRFFFFQATRTLIFFEEKYSEPSRGTR
jgi:hypothetical protein